MAREFLPDLYPMCFNPSSPPKARKAPDWACGSPVKSYRSTALRSGSAAALAMHSMAPASAFSFRRTQERRRLAADFADGIYFYQRLSAQISGKRFWLRLAWWLGFILTHDLFDAIGEVGFFH